MLLVLVTFFPSFSFSSLFHFFLFIGQTVGDRSCGAVPVHPVHGTSSGVEIDRRLHSGDPNDDCRHRQLGSHLHPFRGRKSFETASFSDAESNSSLLYPFHSIIVKCASAWASARAYGSKHRMEMTCWEHDHNSAALSRPRTRHVRACA